MLSIIIIIMLIFIIYNQNQTQQNQQTIINNQRTLWVAIEEIKENPDLQTIPIDELVAKTHGE